ncbi:MAG: hypothetical protein IGS50_00515 [Synechococcales cyanobacterium C42_A2020_086]|nr:hypothetical protein [Synechococcales cyanobacterium C42_A2020_086]
MSYVNWIAGAATFDLSGLPQTYFLPDNSTDCSWIQVTFQALGLQFLLTASLPVEPLHYLVIHHLDYCAIGIQQPNRYVIYLLQPQQRVMPDFLESNFLEWARLFQPEQLATCRGFQAQSG